MFEPNTRLRVSSPSKTFFFFFVCHFFLFPKDAGKFRVLYICRKKACFDVLSTCKATSLSKMAKLVWRYSDDAGAIIETVNKFCMEEKEVWNETVTESCMGQDCSTHWR